MIEHDQDVTCRSWDLICFTFAKSSQDPRHPFPESHLQSCYNYFFFFLFFLKQVIKNYIHWNSSNSLSLPWILPRPVYTYGNRMFCFLHMARVFNLVPYQIPFSSSFMPKMELESLLLRVISEINVIFLTSV